MELPAKCPWPDVSAPGRVLLCDTCLASLAAPAGYLVSVQTGFRKELLLSAFLISRTYISILSKTGKARLLLVLLTDMSARWPTDRDIYPGWSDESPPRFTQTE